MNIIEFYENFNNIYKEIEASYASSIPLCAAENTMSPFVKLPLTSFVQEKYIMGGVVNYLNENNFINSNHLFNIYSLLKDLGNELFDCTYTDGRTLSGVNAVLTVLMSQFKIGDTILITDEECGGHSSMPKICKRLGIRTISLPYDFKNFDFDYIKINKIINSQNISGILICLSDIIRQPQLVKINTKEDLTIIYDATQILGLIASGVIENPFHWFKKSDNFILLGATHKTIPGPTKGLILCNNENLYLKMDTKINPNYLRNNQLHQILSLVFCLEETLQFGTAYCTKIVSNANYFANKLNQRGFDVIKMSKNQFTETHQIFIKMDCDKVTAFKEKAEFYNITLNARYRKIYGGSGIRLGVQEITRFGWTKHEINLLSKTLFLIYDEINHNTNNQEKIKMNLDCLKQPHKLIYTFDRSIIERFEKILHDH